MSKQIDALKKLGLTDEEIADVLATDKKIDKGEKLFELDADQQKASKKARQAQAPTIYQFKPRERKTDTQKTKILNEILKTVENLADLGSVVATNPEREIVFTENGKKFKIVLSCPRS